MDSISTFIAHTRLTKSSDGSIIDAQDQLLSDHLNQAAELAAGYGQSFGLSTACYLAGLLHDCGKFSDGFQKYLRKAVADPQHVRRGEIDHSYAGGLLLLEIAQSMPPQTQQIAEMIANAIVSHHSRSIRDFLTPGVTAELPTFITRLELNDLATQKARFTEFEPTKERFFKLIKSETEIKELLTQAAAEFRLLRPTDPNADLDDLYFMNQNIYSALIDADRTNTMLFEMNRNADQQDNIKILKRYQEILDQNNQAMRQGPRAQTNINQLRAQLSDEAFEAARRPTGIYRLMIPTGGGKTLTGMRFALEHALRTGKKRIIFIEPFTTIIEQNAQVFRKMFGAVAPELADYVVEHHSNVLEDPAAAADPTYAELKRRERVDLIHDTWDGPVLFTTTVAFLNTIFGSGTRNIRRFHNLADAVIIFDEVQALPPKTLQMFNAALNYLSRLANTTAVLCTATQPALDALPNALTFSADKDLITNYDAVEPKFQRVQVMNECKSSSYSVQDIVDLSQKTLEQHHNLLIVLNTKNIVCEVYQVLSQVCSEDTLIYHLSTNMCPQHRLDLLNGSSDRTTIFGDQPIIGIKERLIDAQGKKIIVVTTPLIEAGVDISFEAVIRSVTGLDSIAQAAGRCNRNGERELGDVYLINPDPRKENISKMEELTDARQTTMRLLDMLDRNCSEVLTANTQECYFQTYYRRIIKKFTTQYLLNSGLKLYPLLGKNPAGSTNLPHNLPWCPHLTFSGQTIAKNFQVIADNGHAIIVPYNDDAKKIINELLSQSKLDFRELNRLMKRSQRYLLSISNSDYRKLKDDQKIIPFFTPSGETLGRETLDQAYQNYNKDFGLDISNPELTFSFF
ncbi:CRISPR-associated helicase Cas3' [Lapidilactobacillus luobeiensis]|uniref:CRISPR-associated helicase Cas3' n=1 Tax=Lapidilactobacillus luobeiensis TaxID=2950371 RepID=UPI0021C3D46C|nr:CRISPR-associated helicase Cas3' [Lapidilactobacillus luobeiensis]